MAIGVGDRLPAVTVQEGTPAQSLDMAEAFGAGRYVIFAVPGAFTPGCDRTHLPGYVADYEKFAAKGVQGIACVAVNDAYVMSAWGNAHGADGKVRMIADTNAAFAKAMGTDVFSAGLGGTRTKRYAMVVEDGVVTHLEAEPDGFGLSCSLAGSLLERL